MKIEQDALTFDDVLLLPGYAEILPKDVDLTTNLTDRIQLKTPVLSAAMDTVTEAELAITMAEQGGLGILHKNMSIEAQAKEVKKVKKFESGVVKDAITIAPNATLADLKKITETHHFSGVPVVEGNKLVGIITNRDIRFAKDLRQPVSELMTGKEKLITVPENVTRDEVIEKFKTYPIEKLLMVNDKFELRGMITVRDILKAEVCPNACKDEDDRLCVGAAVGPGQESCDRIVALVDAGVDMLVVDTAHGFSKGVLEQVKWIKQHYPDLDVMAGNIATAEAAEALVKAGANSVKVGMGPGSICTTRIVAGIGVPQITAVDNVCNVLKGKNVSVIADGGIRFSGDLCKSIAAGATAVMIGGLFAGTEEAPGEVVLYQGRSYKAYRGMGSVGAMSGRHSSKDRYFQDEKDDREKLVPEGIEGRVPYKGKLTAVLHQLMGGLRSSMGYTGSKNMDEMRNNTKFIKITNAGMRESHVHDVVITKEAPNYWRDA